MADNLTTEQAQARSEIHEAIASRAEQLGPMNEDGDETVVGACLLSEWVLVSNWVDEAGETWTVTLSSENLIRTHRIGLLESHRHE
jgi:hypothetical protein